MNKKYLQAFTAFVLTCIVFYLAGSFAAASFDINQWDIVGRGICAMCSVLFGGMFVGFIFSDN